MSVSQTTQQGPKKPYQVLDIAFKNLTYGGKVEGKKVMPFGKQEGTFKTLAVANGGDIFEITVVKNDAGFNDWTEAVRTTGEDSGGNGAAAASAPASAGRVPATAGRSTYETPEERANRQVLIVRQSCLSNACSTLAVGSKSAVSPNDVLALAEKYEKWVFRTQDFEDIPELPPAAE